MTRKIFKLRLTEKEMTDNDDMVDSGGYIVVYAATTESGETTTAGELTTPVSQQTSATDSDLSTVTEDLITATDSQTQTSVYIAYICTHTRLVLE